MSKKSPLEQFRQYTEVSYAGRQLLQKHSLDEVGIWKIKGEDPNCDLGGHHYQPELGIVEGTLRDVIMYGVSLPSFWQWGAGGDFELVGRSIPQIDANSVAVRQELEAEEARLAEQLAEVRRQLGKKS
jgi:hypothetical protein